MYKILSSSTVLSIGANRMRQASRDSCVPSYLFYSMVAGKKLNRRNLVSLVRQHKNKKEMFGNVELRKRLATPKEVAE